jgi:adenosylcobyric acid synthase
MGQTAETRKVDPFSVLSGTEEGCSARDGEVFGTYLHDVFHNDEFRWLYLNKLRQKKGLTPIERSLRFRSFKESEYDRLAAHVKVSVEMNKIYSAMKTFNLKEVK